MKKVLFIFSCLLLLFACGCNSCLQVNNKSRISGIISACKQNKTDMHRYLQLKVQNEQIDDAVAYTIQECLKDVK